MKLIKLLPFLIFLGLFTACEDKPEAETEEIAVAEEENAIYEDEVFNSWNDAWNNNDAEAVSRMVAPDAVLVLNGNEVPQDSISPWIEENAPLMKNLRMNSLQRNNAGNMAYDTGTFSHGIKDNDTVQYRGSYTFVYEKPEGSNQWQIVAMNIADGSANSEELEVDDVEE